MNIIPIRCESEWTALEFFDGIGLARAVMEQPEIKIVCTNDYYVNKNTMYEGHSQSGDFLLAEIHALKNEELPAANVARASYPYTDLSLAGKRVGFRCGRESSALFGFTDLIVGMHEHQPEVNVLEKVIGLASSHEKAALQMADNVGMSEQISVQSAEVFIGTNIEEIATYDADRIREGLARLIRIYNTRIEKIKIDKSLKIDEPRWTLNLLTEE